MPRYKIVCQVTLGQRKDQGMRFCSRCLWDTNTDNYATASFKNVRVPAHSMRVRVLVCVYTASVVSLCGHVYVSSFLLTPVCDHVSHAHHGL